MAWQKKRINVPDDFKPGERRELAKNVIDFIKDRTDKQRGVRNGRNYKFPTYSEEYKKSRKYKEAGKTGNVNLRLSNAMIGDLKLISEKKGSILIGYSNSTESNSKAEGNQKGSYGKSPERAKERKFVDITKGDLEKLVREFV